MYTFSSTRDHINPKSLKCSNSATKSKAYRLQVFVRLVVRLGCIGFRGRGEVGLMKQGPRSAGPTYTV